MFCTISLSVNGAMSFVDGAMCFCIVAALSLVLTAFVITVIKDPEYAARCLLPCLYSALAVRFVVHVGCSKLTSRLCCALACFCQFVHVVHYLLRDNGCSILDHVLPSGGMRIGAFCGLNICFIYDRAVCMLRQVLKILLYSARYLTKGTRFHRGIDKALTEYFIQVDSCFASAAADGVRFCLFAVPSKRSMRKA